MSYKLEKSREHPGCWILTDLQNGVVIRFEEHRFNETQHITLLEDSPLSGYNSAGEAANGLARILREMADYMADYWYSIAMPTPVFELRNTDDGRLFLLRNKYPKFRIEIEDDVTKEKLAKALRNASEFLLKRADRHNDEEPPISRRGFGCYIFPKY